jgi:hypothetical protein
LESCCDLNGIAHFHAWLQGILAMPNTPMAAQPVTNIATAHAQTYAVKAIALASGDIASLRIGMLAARMASAPNAMSHSPERLAARGKSPSKPMTSASDRTGATSHGSKRNVMLVLPATQQDSAAASAAREQQMRRLSAPREASFHVPRVAQIDVIFIHRCPTVLLAG